MSERVNDVTPMPSTGPIVRAEEPSAYTPSTEEVKACALNWARLHGDYIMKGFRFDDWLRELQARAWWLGRDAGVKWAQGKADEAIINPYENEEK